jgi:hypothetical protein
MFEHSLGESRGFCFDGTIVALKYNACLKPMTNLQYSSPAQASAA